MHFLRIRVRNLRTADNLATVLDVLRKISGAHSRQLIHHCLPLQLLERRRGCLAEQVQQAEFRRQVTLPFRGEDCRHRLLDDCKWLI